MKTLLSFCLKIPNFHCLVRIEIVSRITDCNVSVNVTYRGVGVALFKDQIAIRGLRGNFSAPGDSGSVVWTWDNRRHPVGLLFAGGGGITFANKMTRVLPALNINLYT